MTEPVYRWQPVTDVYKEQAAQSADIEAANEQKRQELNQAKTQQIAQEKKAPLGIRVFTWYYFCRAGIYALLLLILASFPHSDFSAWLFDGVGNFLHMPGSKSAMDARRREIQRQAQAAGYQISDSEVAELDQEHATSTEEMHNVVMVYLLLMLALTTWVGFMWWNRSWKVRWATMFYSGALVGKAGVNFIAGAASGVGSQIPASVMPMVVLTVGLNGFIFLYLALWPGVKQWFEEVG
jgi:hypothetical protein